MLQFQISNLFGLFVKVHGMALANEEGIRLAFHEPDKEKKLLDANVQSVLIAWPNLDEVDVDYGLLSCTISIRVKSADAIGQLPGLTQNEVTLQIHRRDRKQLEEFEQTIADFRSGRKTDNVDDMLDDIRDFLIDN